MIAPRKKKLIKLIIMAWSVVLVITGSALPVLASPATDDQGNLVPSSFYAQWSIYNVNTQSYDYINVTSSVSKDGLTFTFPYNTYGISYVYLVLYSSSFDLESLYISGSFKYDSDISQTIYYPSGSVSCSFLYNSTSSSYFFDRSSSNPFNFIYSDAVSFPSVSRFRFSFNLDPTLIDGTLSINFSQFLINDIDIKSKIFISNLEDSTEELDDSVEALETALPLPTFDASAFASAEAIADDYTFFNDGLRFSFMESDLVTHIFILVVYFTCLSIAIFGHAGG